MKIITPAILLVVCVVFSLISCDPALKRSGEIPVIDLETTYNETPREFTLSELVENVEYIQLETKNECLVSGIKALAFSEQHVLIFDQSRRLMLFNYKGEYLNDIGKFGRGPGEYRQFNQESLCLSPDGRYVTFSDYRQQIWVYGIDGTFWGYVPIQSRSTYDMDYLQEGTLVVHENKFTFQDGSGSRIRYYDKGYRVIDSCLYYQRDSTMVIKRAPDDEVFVSHDQVFYKDALNDTIYLVEKDDKLTPFLVIDMGPFQLPSYAVTNEEFNMNYFLTKEISLTNRYLTVILNGRARKPGPQSQAYEIIWFDRKKKEGFWAAPQYINDLDGVGEGFWFHRFHDGAFWDEVHPIEYKSFVASDSVDQKGLVNDRFFIELKELLAKSDHEDNPIIRIFYLK